jgi:5-formyltetrahydrofolate cyclo-ligase
VSLALPADELCSRREALPDISGGMGVEIQTNAEGGLEGGSKASRRREARAALSGMAPRARALGSEAISRRLLALPEFLGGSGWVMVFSPLAGEVDLGLFARRAGAMGRRLCHPRVRWGAGDMDAGELPRWGRGLVMARHGVRQPGHAAPRVAVDKISLVLVPGLMFDTLGRRLGRGGGFYDRFLARDEFRPRDGGGGGAKTELAVGVKVGVGFDEQIVGSIPEDAWDVRMDAIVTPTRVIRPG